MGTTWPIFWCLSPAAQALLMQLQWDMFGLRLDIPPLTPEFSFDVEIESLEKIDKLMRKKPHYRRGVGYRG